MSAENTQKRTSNTAGSRFLTAVGEEWKKATTKHAAMNSAHEGYAVILEELEEFWDEVRKQRSEYSAEAMYTELVQIAAMAMRCATDVVEYMPDLKVVERV